MTVHMNFEECIKKKKIKMKRCERAASSLNENLRMLPMAAQAIPKGSKGSPKRPQGS